MPIVPHLWLLAARVSWLVGGARLHRAGLEALHRGEVERADGLFEAAAAGYRRELRVEALARLRVHQRIARARRDPASEALLEIERGLAALTHIESLDPPFESVAADSLLARVLHDAGCRGATERAAA